MGINQFLKRIFTMNEENIGSEEGAEETATPTSGETLSMQEAADSKVV